MGRHDMFVRSSLQAKNLRGANRGAEPSRLQSARLAFGLDYSLGTGSSYKSVTPLRTKDQTRSDQTRRRDRPPEYVSAGAHPTCFRPTLRRDGTSACRLPISREAQHNTRIVILSSPAFMPWSAWQVVDPCAGLRRAQTMSNFIFPQLMVSAPSPQRTYGRWTKKGAHLNHGATPRNGEETARTRDITLKHADHVCAKLVTTGFRRLGPTAP